MQAPQAPPPPTRLSLQPALSPSSGFLLPSLHAFPPFFTRQPNPQTWAHQLDQWRTLVLAWARFTRTFRIDCSHETCGAEPFANHAIKRQLSLPTLRLVLDSLVASGSAAWDTTTLFAGGKKSATAPAGARGGAVWIYWKRPEEWATAIYDWIKETGQTNSIMTFYELTEGGDLVHTTDFYRLPTPILRKALDILIKQGKAQVLKGSGDDGDGVKFV
ncbi:hypothetical protein Rhopal_004811-T1 [Rhodotorula paludigena]|uniref:ESCRT-II complex subunit VPS25 n=1 Tax=Rhodotorula paludigena TaxID=86838 RepID=A0AAV5GNM5_9BASI|nr:hypothetical protein Rhopal_004811-T1 [Rhodotorula paludigena]